MIGRSVPALALARWTLVALAAGLAACWIFDQPSLVGIATLRGGLLVNSDSLLPAAFAWDVLTHPAAWHGFQLPRVPSLVPDLLVNTLLQAATGSWRWAYLLYAALYLGGMAACAGLVVDAMLATGLANGALVFLGLAIPMLVVEVAVPPLRQLHVLSFSLAAHGGPFLLSLGGLTLVWRACRRPGWILYAAVFGVGAAAVVSDRLCCATLIGPACVGVVSAVHNRLLAWRPAAWLLAILAGSCWAGWRLFDLLLTQPEATVEWSAAGAHAAAFAAAVAGLAEEAPWRFGAVWLLPLIGTLLLRCPPAWPVPAGPARAAASFWWSVGASAIAANLLLATLLHTDSFRYLAAALWWPLILSTALVARLLGRFPGVEAIAPALTGAMVAAVGLAYGARGPHLPDVLTARNPLGACVRRLTDTEGLHAGLAFFWPARLAAADSSWALQIDQILPTGAIQYWGNDRFWYVEDVHRRGAPPPYDFIVMDELDASVIRQRFGAPDRTFDCAGTTLWAYDQPDRLRQVLARSSVWVLSFFLADGRPLCIPPDLLRAEPDAGVHPERQRVSIEGRGLDGALALSGPVITLPAGTWKVGLSYDLHGGEPATGRWDVAGQDQGRLEAGRHTAEAVVTLRRRRAEAVIRARLPEGVTLDLFGARIAPEPARLPSTEPCP